MQDLSMTTYIERDIAATFNGDLELDPRGDLKLANSLETYKSAANMVLRTDYGDYAANSSVGSDLGSFIGDLNVPETHREMEISASRSLTTDLFTPADVDVTVVPFDIEEALVVVNLAGYFLIDDEITYVEEDRIAYSFPFIDANPSPLVV